MTHYLIEFRFRGKARTKLKSLIWDVDKKCRLGHARRKRPIPHVTLVAPFKTRNERKLIHDFNDLCSRTKLMKFSVNGFNTFEHNNYNSVVYIDIHPSENLNKFRQELARTLEPYCELTPYDKRKEYFFHSTVAMKLNDNQFKRVNSYVKRKNNPKFEHIVARVTLLKGARILREYDFFLRRPLTRRMAKSRYYNQKTTQLMKQFFTGEFHPNEKVRSIKRKISLWNKIKSIFN